MRGSESASEKFSRQKRVSLRGLDTLAGFAVTKALKLVQLLKPLTWLRPPSLRPRLLA
jgi:hypothetical protein